MNVSLMIIDKEALIICLWSTTVNNITNKFSRLSIEESHQINEVHKESILTHEYFFFGNNG